MSRSVHPLLLALAALAALAQACGQVPEGKPAANLSSFEKVHGVGPVKEPLVLEPISADLAAQGQRLYQMSCSSCHRLDRRFVGPPLGGITTRRTPEFVLNMILNPQGMLEKHPEARKLLEKYLTPMPPQSVSPAEARAILEYLRTTPPPVE